MKNLSPKYYLKKLNSEITVEYPKWEFKIIEERSTTTVSDLSRAKDMNGEPSRQHTESKELPMPSQE